VALIASQFALVTNVIGMAGVAGAASNTGCMEVSVSLGFGVGEGIDAAQVAN
jgi:hypothetical protein